MRPWVPLLIAAFAGGCVGEPECVPIGGGPYWVEEGEPVSFAVTCETGAALSGDQVAVAPLPSGAAWDPATARLSWTPGLTQAAVYQIGLGVGAETGAVTIGVADAFDAPGNTPVVDPLQYPLEFGLPVLFLSPGPLGTSSEPVDVVYRGRAYSAQAEKRGAASLGYPKNSYTVEFGNNDPFEEPELAGGMVRRRIVLLSTFDDNSQVRQRLAYDAWNAIDAEHIQMKTYSAVVYVDGAYHGMYTVADAIDGDLMARHGLARNGNLYKAINHDANFRLDDNDGFPKSALSQGYEKKEGDPPEGQAGAFTDLEALVQWGATVDAAGFAAGRADRLDARDYENWWIYVTAILADDSAGKNSYHYHDPAGGPFRYVPWDFNHSFGQTWQTEREAADIRDDYLDNNRLFELSLADAGISAAIYARYQSLRAGAFSASALLALIDAYAAEVAPGARRDQRRWAAEYRTYGGWNWRSDFTDWDQEMAYLRQWVSARWAFLDATY